MDGYNGVNNVIYVHMYIYKRFHSHNHKSQWWDGRIHSKYILLFCSHN